ncbi:hypothetical protein [Nonomuraea sp. LPB2021202275-12-8]|uniref:hypothetical protein n=1 Tax=Nonomuraea sp. LPB2021202275-12-8 TaxID=3120159 RepID=UPI00300C862F
MLMTLGLTMASSSCTTGSTLTSCERLRLVGLNSFAVTHGDYELKRGTFGEACEDGTLPIHLGPRSAMSDTAQWSDEIRWGDSGEVLSPYTLPWRLTSILGDATGMASAEAELGDQKTLLESIPSGMPVQVVVVLAKPLKESEVRALWSDPRTLLMAPAQPLIWEEPISCDHRGFDTCAFDTHPEPFTAQFRKWVSLLRADDAPILAQFKLKLPQLQKYASDGLVYGFTARNLPDPIRAIVKDPRIRAVYVVDTDLPRP